MQADAAADEPEAGFLLMRNLSGLKNDGGGGGGAGGGGGGLSFCSATSSLFTRSTSETDRLSATHDMGALINSDRERGGGVGRVRVNSKSVQIWHCTGIVL